MTKLEEYVYVYEIILTPGGCQLYVYDHYFLTLSSLKPLCQSKPNCMCRLLEEEGMKVSINGPGHLTKMAAMPIYGKDL